MVPDKATRRDAFISVCRSVTGVAQYRRKLHHQNVENPFSAVLSRSQPFDSLRGMASVASTT